MLLLAESDQSQEVPGPDGKCGMRSVRAGLGGTC